MFHSFQIWGVGRYKGILYLLKIKKIKNKKICNSSTLYVKSSMAYVFTATSTVKLGGRGKEALGKSLLLAVGLDQALGGAGTSQGRSPSQQPQDFAETSADTNTSLWYWKAGPLHLDKK